MSERFERDVRRITSGSMLWEMGIVGLLGMLELGWLLLYWRSGGDYVRFRMFYNTRALDMYVISFLLKL